MVSNTVEGIAKWPESADSARCYELHVRAGRILRRFRPLEAVRDSKPSRLRGPNPVGLDRTFSCVALVLQIRGDIKSALENNVSGPLVLSFLCGQL
jgi:hypothetical protein